MKCSNCGKSLWFVKDYCIYCKTAFNERGRAKLEALKPNPNQKAIDFAKEIKTIQKTWNILGLLAVVGGGIFILYCVFGTPGKMDESDKGMVGYSLFAVAWGALLLFVSRAMASRKSWTRKAGVAVSTVCLAGFPIGTIFGCIWLAGLLSPEAKVWFSGGEVDKLSEGKRRGGLATLFGIIGIVLLIIVVAFFILGFISWLRPER